MNDNCIVITGVAGLLGSRMASWILQEHPEFKVVGIDNLSGGFEDFIPENIDFIRADLSTESLEEVLKGYEVIYFMHFAAYAAEGLSPFIRKFNYQNNLVATANVVNFCINHGVNRLLFTSSMAVYGTGNPPFDETDQPLPVDPYGVAKYACELDIQIAAEQHGLDYCIIRPHNVYGENQNIWDKYRNVLGIWMFQKLNDQPFTVFGSGDQKRAFSHIADILEPLWLALTSSKSRNEIFNLGGIKETSILEAAEMLADIVGGTEIQFLEQRHEVKYAYPTYQKSVNILNYSEKVDLETGLRKMWSWVQELPRRDRFEWSGFEIDRGMYQYWKE